jgi:glutathione synthase/RimK-type ligase-like ATP-grasp enzyme
VETTSDAIDYWWDTPAMFPTSLPEAIAEKCRVVSKTLVLLAAGIDLIRSTDGEWYFLEANPSPAFTSYPDRDDVAGPSRACS